MNSRSTRLYQLPSLQRLLGTAAFLVCLVVVSGCASLPNAPLSSASSKATDTEERADTEEPSAPKTFAERQAKWREFFHSPFGESAGLDPRAREIERRLGY